MKKIDELTIENGLSLNLSTNFIVERQKSFSRKRVDIVISTVSNNESISTAIEIKVKDWKVALKQAHHNQVYFDNSYVAMWYEHAKPALDNIKIFSSLGIGLMVIDSLYRPHIMLNPCIQLG